MKVSNRAPDLTFDRFYLILPGKKKDGSKKRDKRLHTLGQINEK